MAVAILMSIGAIIIALTISMGMSDQKQLYWGVNFAKSIIQDFFFNPLLSLLLNSLLIFCVVRRTSISKRLRGIVEKLTDENLNEVVKAFTSTTTRRKARVPPVSVFLMLHD